MTIRFAEITNKGDIIDESELDSATCDCCQTSIAVTNKGPVVVYRDRSDKEVRDIYIARKINGIWGVPTPIHNDGWEINGCPVNGPKVASNSNLRIKKVSIDGKVSAPITISKIDGGRNSGVPQLEILDNEAFIVWTVLKGKKNQLKTVKLSFKDT